MRSLEALLSRVVSAGSVLAVGAEQLPTPGEPSRTRALDAPDDAAALDAALGSLSDDAFDAALAAGWGKDLTPRAVVAGLRRTLRPGAPLVLVAPAPRAGWTAVVRMLRRRRAVPREALCEALLLEGLVDVRARRPEDAAVTVAWARLPTDA
ncbi:MAG TPA: hypothetical protein RMH99_31430 [Sandaracinaceae bacterium LLY-WYZ-13_1]|nr:hypothetical protein [Sandaracinaceae bacterium LLY-WYZ-13_1]